MRTHTGIGLAPKIALVTVLITFVGLAAVTALGYASVIAVSRDAIGRQLEGRAANVARVIDARVASALQSLQALTWSEEVQKAVLGARRSVLGPVKAGRLGHKSSTLLPAEHRTPSAEHAGAASLERLLTAHLWELLATDRRGWTVSASEGGEAQAHGNEEWFRTAIRDGVYVADRLKFDRSSALWVLPLAVAIRDSATGEYQGVLRGLYNWETIQDDLVQMERQSPSAYVLVVDADDHLLASPGTSDPWRAASEIREIAPLLSRARQQANGWLRLPSSAPQLVGVAHSRGYLEYEGKPKWWAAVGDEENVLLAGARRSVHQMMLVAAALMLLVLLGTAGSVRFFMAPLRHVTEAMVRVGEGDLSARARVGTRDEIGCLADQFDQMTGQLQDLYVNLERKVEERTAALRESEAFYHSLVEGLPQNILRKDWKAASPSPTSGSAPRWEDRSTRSWGGRTSTSSRRRWRRSIDRTMPRLSGTDRSSKPSKSTSPRMASESTCRSSRRPSMTIAGRSSARRACSGMSPSASAPRYVWL